MFRWLSKTHDLLRIVIFWLSNLIWFRLIIVINILCQVVISIRIRFRIRHVGFSSFHHLNIDINWVLRIFILALYSDLLGNS